ncbi:protein FAR1-RELATED SEQUENCE [Trifolium repens]|nr:protein FAR1-RELATED SEQUENCE [Trifolium repens]
MNESSTPIAEGVQKLVNNIQVNIVENGRESVVNYIPHLEIEFESEVAAYDFYNEYNKKMGFGIRREYGNKSKVDGILTSRRFTCFKEGNRGVYKVIDFVSEHNHILGLKKWQERERETNHRK